MHRTRLSVLPILILSACATGFTPSSAAPPSPAGKSGVVTILSTNDFHGRYTPIAAGPGDATSQEGDPGVDAPHRFVKSGMVGGFPVLASEVERIRRERGREKVLLVHAGDTFSDDLLGNLTRGEAMIRLMNALEYHFMAFGNHDFDYGVERTRELSKMADFPMRGANVVEMPSGAPFLGEPYLLWQVGPLRIAVLALGYHNTPWTTDPENVEGVRFTSGIEAARRYVPHLRSRADLVVVLSHQGAKVDEILAREVEGIDLIIGGHSHDLMDFDEKREGRIIQALSDGTVLSETFIRIEDGKIREIPGTNHILWNGGATPDGRISALIDETRKGHRETLEEVLAVAEEAIPRQYKSESPFDVWVGERLIEESGADLAILPGVGYGISIQKGPVTRELLYTLVPHESKLVTLELTGWQIREILEQSASNLAPQNPMEGVGGLIQTAGLIWTMDLRRPSGERITEVSLAGGALRPEGVYTVATHSGMLAGIHRYTTFGKGENIRTQTAVNRLIERKMKSMGRIKAPATGRITVLRSGAP